MTPKKNKSKPNSRKKSSRIRKALAMVPCTDQVMAAMMRRVLEVMGEHGLVDVTADPDDVSDQVMAVMQAQGLTDAHGNVKMGRCLLLPGTASPGLSLLIATPWPAEEHDETLRRKPSPVRFDRNRRGQIVLPGRAILGKLEELADNPTASAVVRTAALTLARRALPLPPIVLPPQAETVALTVSSDNGAERIIEALTAGLVLSVGTE
jgi:hypothetical protein